MNILILNWKDIRNPEAGGAEVVTSQFARNLVQEGHQVTLFCRTFPHCLPSEELDGVQIIRQGGKLSTYWKAFLYYRSLAIKPDIVVDMVNTICWQTPLYVPLEKRVAYVNQLAREVLFYELPFPVSVIFYFSERLQYLPYTNTPILCFSKSTQQDLTLFGIPKKNTHLFSLGLDHSSYFQGTQKTKHPLFLFVARLVRMKNTDLCIRAMKSVIKKHPTAKLVILGNGPDRKRLQQIVGAANLGNHVVFIDKDIPFFGPQVKNAKVTLMQQAWALLLPSVKEGWGMVVTEAAACGTPAIVSDVTGLRDSVVHNKTGIMLSKSPNPEEMEVAMLKIIEDTQLRQRLSQGALQWSKNFSWEKSYIEFKKALGQALNKKL